MITNPGKVQVKGIRHLDQIDWSPESLNLCFIKDGAFGRTFRIGPAGTQVLKIGTLARKEVSRQAIFSAFKLAVPPLDVWYQATLPGWVRKTACYWHGTGRPGPEVDNWGSCSCGSDKRMDVLLMPFAAKPIDEGYTPEEVALFARSFKKFSAQILPGFDWDAQSRNVGVYKGKLVALDFGDR